MAPRWTSIEVGLVLQGGGALGAYEWGAIEALFGLMDELQDSKPVIAEGRHRRFHRRDQRRLHRRREGTAGRGRARPACEALGRSAAFTRRSTAASICGRSAAELFVRRATSRCSALPGFYVPRMDFWNFWQLDQPLQHEHARRHAEGLCLVRAINASPTTFVVTAVDVESGTLRRFRNQARPTRAESDRAEEKNDPVVFEPKHILASGSLAPQFPWTDDR